MIDPPSSHVLSPSPHVLDCELRAWATSLLFELLIGYEYPRPFAIGKTKELGMLLVEKETFGSKRMTKSAISALMEIRLTWCLNRLSTILKLPFGRSFQIAMTRPKTSCKNRNAWECRSVKPRSTLHPQSKAVGPCFLVCLRG